MAQKNRDWRELCEAVASERDSERLSELTEEVIAALDGRKIRPATRRRLYDFGPVARRSARDPRGRVALRADPERVPS